METEEEGVYRPLPGGELDQGTSVKPPHTWPESALTSTREGAAPSHREWKALACKQQWLVSTSEMKVHLKI